MISFFEIMVILFFACCFFLNHPLLILFLHVHLIKIIVDKISIYLNMDISKFIFNNEKF